MSNILRKTNGKPLYKTRRDPRPPRRAYGLDSNLLLHLLRQQGQSVQGRSAGSRAQGCRLVEQRDI
jgi:hypothetical protein